MDGNTRKERSIWEQGYIGKQVTVQPATIPREKALTERFCELCRRQNATLEHFVCISVTEKPKAELLRKQKLFAVKVWTDR